MERICSLWFASVQEHYWLGIGPRPNFSSFWDSEQPEQNKQNAELKTLALCTFEVRARDFFESKQASERLVSSLANDDQWAEVHCFHM